MKLQFLNSVNFSQNPWKYSKGSFYTPSKLAYVPPDTEDISQDQLLYRLYLLFPKIAREEIKRVYEINKHEVLTTIDTLMFAEICRARNRLRCRRGNRSYVPGRRKLASQCARTCVTVKPRPRKANWRTVTSGFVHNRPSNTGALPQVQQVINNSNCSSYNKRLRQIATNVTFDYRGIRHAVFEDVRRALKNIENTVPPGNAPTLDIPGQESSLLHQRALATSRANSLSRNSIKMKLFRCFGGEYRSEMVNY